MAELVDLDTFGEEMAKDEIFDWFRRKLNRQPEAYDVYKVAKEFYQLGAYKRSKLCLQQYVSTFEMIQISMAGSLLPGRHLLGYCYLNLGESENALHEFKRCVKEGFHEDWQLVVELTMEIEQQRRENNL